MRDVTNAALEAAEGGSPSLFPPLSSASVIGLAHKGDWCCPNMQCVNHQNTVYGSKPMCSKCGIPKPALGGRGAPAMMAMQQGYPGMYAGAPGGCGGYPGQAQGARPGDWHCANTECKNFADNVVYASKAACPICGTPKPVAPREPPPMAAARPAYGWVQPFVRRDESSPHASASGHYSESFRRLD